MQHYLVAAPVSLFGDRGGVRVQRKDGESERVVQSENLIESRGVAANIIKNNRQFGGGHRGSMGGPRCLILGRRVSVPSGLTLGLTFLAAGDRDQQRQKSAEKATERPAVCRKKI